MAMFSSNCFFPARLMLPTPERDRRVKSDLQLSSACNEGSPHPPQQPFQCISRPQAPIFSADGCLLLCSENNSHLYLRPGSYSFSAPQEPQAMHVPTFLGLPKITPSAFSILQSLVLFFWLLLLFCFVLLNCMYLFTWADPYNWLMKLKDILCFVQTSF